MFSFAKPRYLSKHLNPLTQKIEPSYQFDVRAASPVDASPVIFLLEPHTPLTVKRVEEVLLSEQEWWHGFLQSFLTATTPYFTRTYTVQHLQRILRHLLSPTNPFSPSEPHHICCIPRMLELIGGQLLVHWSYTSQLARIDIPDDLPLPAVSPSDGGMREWDVDLVPEQLDSTESLTHPERLLDKQRVREARLKAKVAVYRAQYQMNRYYEKYGDEVSESEPDSEEEDDEEEDEDAE
jgi:hypothetical protein